MQRLLRSRDEKLFGKKAADSEQNLNRAEQQTLEAIQKWDEDPQYIELSESTFSQSNALFSDYKTAQCSFSASLAGGAAGNSHDNPRLACIAKINDERAEQLRGAVTVLPPKQ